MDCLHTDAPVQVNADPELASEQLELVSSVDIADAGTAAASVPQGFGDFRTFCIWSTRAFWLRICSPPAPSMAATSSSALACASTLGHVQCLHRENARLSQATYPAAVLELSWAGPRRS